MQMKKDVLLKGIADLIITYENPTESNQKNVIGVYLEIDNEFYEYDGEKFIKPEKSLIIQYC